jgi:DNA helicase MCM9
MDDLLNASVELANLLLAYPRNLLPLLEEAIRGVQATMLAIRGGGGGGEGGGDRGDGGEQPTVKQFVHARLVDVPAVFPVEKVNISSVRCADADRFLRIEGTVVRTGAVKMLDAEREYRCRNPKCRHSFRVKADPQQGNILELPKSCPAGAAAGDGDPPGFSGELDDGFGQQGVGKPSARCKGTSFELMEETRVCIDYQEIKVQEQVQRLTMGSIPRSITVVIENDLVDTCQAGDDVIVCGTAMLRWAPLKKGERVELEVGGGCSFCAGWR